MLTTQFFAHEDPALPARPRHRSAPCCRRSPPRRTATAPLNPNAWRRTPLSVEEIADVDDGAATRSPSTCSARRPRAPWRWCCAAADLADRFTDPPVCLRSCVMRSRALRHVRGVQPVAGARARRRARPRSTRPGPRSSAAGIGPERRRRRPDPGHRVRRRADAHGRDRAVRPRRAGRADQHGPDRDRRPAADQHRRRLPRQRRADRRVGAAPGPRERRCSCAAPPASARCPASRRSPSPTSTARRASAPARCCRGEHGAMRPTMARSSTETFADGIPPEVAPVRAGRGARLGSRSPAYLHRAARRRAATADGPAVPQRLGQPHVPARRSARRRRQFVLRRPPFGVVAPGAHDMKREFRVLVAAVAVLRPGAAGLRVLRRPRRRRQRLRRRRSTAAAR